MSKCKYKHEEYCSYIDQYCVEGPCKYEEPQTNADRIRAMTDEEMAEFMSNKVDCQYCNVKTEWCSESEIACRRGWLDWLKQEAEE